MIKVCFIPKDRGRPIKAVKSFYIDTCNYKAAEDVARVKFSKDPAYKDYGIAVCVELELIYPGSAEFNN